MRKQKQKQNEGRKERNPLRGLSRLQLMELLARQEKEIQSLRAALAEKEAALAERALVMERAGSIAEAALQLNGVFEAAQRAADQYLQSLARRTAAAGERQKPAGKREPWESD